MTYHFERSDLAFTVTPPLDSGTYRIGDFGVYEVHQHTSPWSGWVIVPVPPAEDFPDGEYEVTPA
jgi:hypothetical protein